MGGLIDNKPYDTGLKPDITHVRTPILNYIGRASEFGTVKYQERSNYIRPTTSIQDDFKRLRGYLRAMVSHTVKTLDAMERYQSKDPQLQDVEAMKAACFAPDTDPGNERVGPSNLPHLAHAGASLNMALEQAVNAGLLPADPGVTWTKKS